MTLLLLTLLAAEPLPLSLPKAIELATAPSGNLRLQIVRTGVEQAEARRRQALGAFLPNLDGSISASSQTRNLAAFGFRFPQNFNYPYVATSLQDFWRRWHMTLSRWLRDYLYIALGGNRRGPTRTQVNLMLTMLLGGLWHGASWNFVIWGAIHGLWLAIERSLLQRLPGFDAPFIGMRLFRWFLTFHVVCFAWIFFRAPDLTASVLVLSKLAALGDISAVWPQWSMLALALIGFGVLHGIGASLALKRRLGDAPLWLHASATLLCLLVLVVFTPNHSAPFIYFQF